MPKCRIIITEAAEQDLVNIVEYIASDNPGAALKMANKIEENILKLEDFPLIGVSPKSRRLVWKGYRMLIIEDYLVFYVLLDKETVEIRRIINGKKDY